MRRATSVLMSLVIVPVGVIAAPVLEPTAPAPRPVAAKIQDIALPVDESVASVDRSGRRIVVATGQRDTGRFETYGLTWAAEPDLGAVTVQGRTRTRGEWTPWTELEVDPDPTVGNRGDDTLGRRAGTEPTWVGASDGVQVRLAVSAGKAPQAVELNLIDPGDSPADTAARPLSNGSVADAATTRPPIRSRAAWGADESLRRSAPAYSDSVQAVAVNHTASSNDYAPEDVPAILRSFYAFHVQSRGWADIGYNVLVDKFGTAWEGRAGGLDKPVVGAHAGGFNTDTSGLSIIGNYDQVKPSAAAMETVAQVAAWKLSLDGRDPQGSVQLTSRGSTRYPAGTVVTLPRIFGHRDVSTTACPGAHVYSAMPALRERAGALAAASPSGDAAAGDEPTPAPAAPTQSPFGAYDTASPGAADVRVTGWAIDPDASTYTSVAVSVDGTPTGTLVADRYDADVARDYPQYSPHHGFDGTVPAPAGTRVVCVTARNQGIGEDTPLGCKTVTVGASEQPAPTEDPPTDPVEPERAPVPPARSTDDSCPPGRVPSAGFNDVSGNVHAPAIDCTVWWSVATGLTSSTYAPGQAVTRGQMASFLARAILRSGGSLSAEPPQAFDDVDEGTHQLAINQLAAAGVVRGKGGGSYDPDGTVTRGQMASFLVQAYEYRTSRSLPAGADYFEDDDGDLHEPSIGKIARAGFSGGADGAAFRPGRSTDRAQMASFLTRMLDLLVEAGDATQPR